MTCYSFLRTAAAFLGLLTSALSAAEIVCYKTVAGRALNLRVEKPEGWTAKDRRPAVVFFFGGGWVGGTPEQFQKQSAYLASRGLIGFRVEYRTIPKGDKGPPVMCCEDAKSAIRFVRAYAAEWGVDPGRIAAAGGSAGGHLAAFTSLVPGLDDKADDLTVSCRPDALVLFNPVFNNGPGEWGYERTGSRYQEFSPAHHIKAGAPPTIVFLGDNDKLIPVRVVEDFRRGMEKAGARCDTHIFPGMGHGFFNKPPAFDETLILTDRFLASLGWLKGEPTHRPANGNPPPAPATSTPDK